METFRDNIQDEGSQSREERNNLSRAADYLANAFFAVGTAFVASPLIHLYQYNLSPREIGDYLIDFTPETIIGGFIAMAGLAERIGIGLHRMALKHNTRENFLILE